MGIKKLPDTCLLIIFIAPYGHKRFPAKNCVVWPLFYAGVRFKYKKPFHNRVGEPVFMFNGILRKTNVQAEDCGNKNTDAFHNLDFCQYKANGNISSKINLIIEVYNSVNCVL